MGWRWRRKNITGLLQHTGGCKGYSARFVSIAHRYFLVEAMTNELLTMQFFFFFFCVLLNVLCNLCIKLFCILNQIPTILEIIFSKYSIDFLVAANNKLYFQLLVSDLAIVSQSAGLFLWHVTCQNFVELSRIKHQMSSRNYLYGCQYSRHCTN